jgi:hypothetical protein
MDTSNQKKDIKANKALRETLKRAFKAKNFEAPTNYGLSQAKDTDSNFVVEPHSMSEGEVLKVAKDAFGENFASRKLPGNRIELNLDLAYTALVESDEWKNRDQKSTQTKAEEPNSGSNTGKLDIAINRQIRLDFTGRLLSSGFKLSTNYQMTTTNAVNSIFVLTLVNMLPEAAIAVANDEFGSDNYTVKTLDAENLEFNFEKIYAEMAGNYGKRLGTGKTEEPAGPGEQVRFSINEQIKQANSKNKEETSEPVVDDRVPFEKPILPLLEEHLEAEVAKGGITLRKYLDEYCITVAKGELISLYYTRNFEYRSLFIENRDIKKPKLKALMESFKEDGMHFTVTYLDEKLREVEGQHRIETANMANIQFAGNPKFKGLGFYFFIMVGWGKDEIKVINANMNSWGTTDRIKSYIKEGNENYKRFEDFHIKYDEAFSYTTCQILLLSRRTKAANNKYSIKDDEFIGGKLIVTNENMALGIERADQIVQLKKFHKNGWSSRNFVEAMLKMFSGERFNFEQLLARFKKEPDNLFTEADVQSVDWYVTNLIKTHNVNQPVNKHVIVKGYTSK